MLGSDVFTSCDLNMTGTRSYRRSFFVSQALPDTDKEIMAKLDQLKTEAEPLLQQKAKIDNHAHRQDSNRSCMSA